MTQLQSAALLAAVVLLCPPTAAAGSEVNWTLDAERLAVGPPGERHYAVSAAAYAAAPELADEFHPGTDPDGREDLESQLAERLATLEAKYGDLESAHESLEKSLKGYAKTGHSGATMKVNGRIHFDMWGFPGDSPGVNGFETGDPNETPQDRIGFRRIRIGAKGDLPYNMLYKLELELAGGEESEIRDVYLGWKELPFFQTLLIGNQKRPYGLDHMNSSRFNVFLERPFVIEAFNQDARRLGIESYGVSDDQAWNWRYGVFNQRLVQDEGKYISDHWQCEVAGRLANTIWWDEASDGRGYAHWALAGTLANTDQSANELLTIQSAVSEARFRQRPEARSTRRWLDTGIIAGADDYTLLAAEGVVNVGPVQFVAEQQNIFLDRVGGNQLYLHGGYAYVSYFLTGEHVPWNRRTGNIDRVKPFENFFLVDTCDGCTGHGLGAWQVALRWSYADFADRDIRGGDGESLTLGINWHWTPYAKMQFNYLYGEIKDNDVNTPAGAPNYGNYHIVGTRFLIDY